MRDLTSPKIIWFKGALLLIVGLGSSVLLIAENPTLRTGLLLAIAVWAFCRAYYFAFYVIEHYVDRSYRFSGLWSFFRYSVRQSSDNKPGQG